MAKTIRYFRVTANSAPSNKFTRSLLNARISRLIIKPVESIRNMNFLNDFLSLERKGKNVCASALATVLKKFVILTIPEKYPVTMLLAKNPNRTVEELLYKLGARLETKIAKPSFSVSLMARIDGRNNLILYR